ncbi:MULTISPECIES: SixA phosphatase family protein [Hydrocarboniphaga]|jgi:phosphohistidine phosphatase|uniref:Phosphohistidine phosphatase, SixA n=1 Tax=Hydrocarboniphaga effusa AP103 TaxID=1172194 RepID=I7Z8I5_9GAMM|nr:MULTISPECIES: histidine phosphatase family protein [Hydrocarboniphaga]EIT68129.1 hypothetical protein WQQ_45640 [Hydrocarboniphaga effusa AP103]MDZ4078226.1 histidine phosphatase family protein [Hydrocarboniphaga sp.]
MRTLTLIRHAKSSWDDPKIEDFHRPLNERGFRDAPVMAQRLGNLLDATPQLVASPALRTTTTARIFAEVLGIAESSIRFEPPIYDATAAELLAVVRELDDAYPNVALFGHNPGLTDLSHRLARCTFGEMPTCAMAVLEFDVDRWADVAHGRLFAYSFPKERQ